MGYFVFNVRKGRVNKKGLSTIYIKYYYDGQTATFINTGESIKPSLWNFKDKKPKNTKDNQELIKRLKKNATRLNSILQELDEKNIEPTTNYVKELFLSESEFEIDGKAIGFMEQLDAFIKRREENKEVSKDTIKDYKSLRKHLKGFQNKNGYKLKFDHINYNFYQAFVSYLRFYAEKPNGSIGLRENSVGKQIKNLKIFIRDRVKSGEIPFIDLSAFTVLKERAKPIFLTPEEIDKIRKTKFSNKRLEECRDILVIGSLTGMRYSDLSRITKERVVDGLVHIKQKKTNDMNYYPLDLVSEEILAKYDNNIPVVNLTIFNRLVKEVGKAAGIDTPVLVEYKVRDKMIEKVLPKYKFISSRICRKSFATNRINSGFRRSDVMNATGHKTEKSFNIYVDHDKMRSAQRMRDDMRNS